MLVLMAGLLLVILPFLLVIGPIVVWAAWPSIALFAAVYAVHAIQRRRQVSPLAHQS
jgi:dolichyl-phosphate-mannose--protein O-mannosyl transferase